MTFPADKIIINIEKKERKNQMKDYLTFMHWLDESYTRYDLRYTPFFVEITVYGCFNNSITFKFIRQNGDFCEAV